MNKYNKSDEEIVMYMIINDDNNEQITNITKEVAEFFNISLLQINNSQDGQELILDYFLQ